MLKEEKIEKMENQAKVRELDTGDLEKVTGGMLFESPTMPTFESPTIPNTGFNPTHLESRGFRVGTQAL